MSLPIIPYSLFIIHFFCHSFQRLLRPPAAGYRANSTGALTEVGDGGWCYSSSSRAAADFGAGYFGFREHEVDPLWRKSGSRAYGLSVRCVQHLPTAFLQIVVRVAFL